MGFPQNFLTAVPRRVKMEIRKLICWKRRVFFRGAWRLPRVYRKNVLLFFISYIMSRTASVEKTNRGQEYLRGAKKIPLKRVFTKTGVHPFDEVKWKKVKVTVRGINKHVEERELEFPEFWSDTATSIAGAKYFRGRIGSSDRESSARQMIDRVAGTIRLWGLRSGYFDTEEEANVFGDELTHILLHQKAAFNSPVWFNVGVEEKPQCSACFILSVEDNLQSILQWIYNEGMIFKGGSGSGVNLSPLRSYSETLSKGGHSSGPVSFMRGADSVAGMIASGGSTRRAAKMVVMNIDHPDIVKFIRSKAEEEKKVLAFIQAGYNMYDLNDLAWNSIQYQNANNSVRVTDEFMQAVEQDEKFSTRFVVSGKVAEVYRARDLMQSIAQAAWESGDPGMQYDTTINKWHTLSNTGRINASNPCAEYMSIDDSACNLSSINLLKFVHRDGSFGVREFVHTVDIMILAQEIIVGNSSYPTEKIAQSAVNFRQLGLGYANLGALLMTWGLPYDSDEARHTAGAITSLMCGEAYRYSAEIAKRVGSYSGYLVNKKPQLGVISMHRDALERVRENTVRDKKIYQAALRAWDGALASGRRYGIRNSQVTVIAPTGTIALMMDCATTGVEPEFALVKYKQLVGGGTMKLVNTAVPEALRRLGYTNNEKQIIVEYIEKQGTIEGAPGFKEEHAAVFDCAVKPSNGKRVIHWQGHVKMVAAVQPFVSGAISKTFNMLNETTVEEIMKAYVMGWKLGLKAFAVYRDGSKAAQPLVTSSGRGGPAIGEKPARRHLPATRPSETHKFSIVGHEGYLTYSTFENGDLAEIFIRMSKQGSTLAGLLDAFAIAISIAMQHGVPLKTLARKFAYWRFEPAGYTENPAIQIATSITDYIFRYLALRFLAISDLDELGIKAPLKEVEAMSKRVGWTPEKRALADVENVVYADTVCRECGGMLVQTGSCKTCLQCGTANGGC